MKLGKCSLAFAFCRTSLASHPLFRFPEDSSWRAGEPWPNGPTEPSPGLSAAMPWDSEPQTQTRPEGALESQVAAAINPVASHAVRRGSARALAGCVRRLAEHLRRPNEPLPSLRLCGLPTGGGAGRNTRGRVCSPVSIASFRLGQELNTAMPWDSEDQTQTRPVGAPEPPGATAFNPNRRAAPPLAAIQAARRSLFPIQGIAALSPPSSGGEEKFMSFPMQISMHGRASTHRGILRRSEVALRTNSQREATHSKRVIWMPFRLGRSAARNHWPSC